MLKRIFSQFNNKELPIERIFIFLISVFIFFSVFINIPTDQTFTTSWTIGISASGLDIGDRPFYISESGESYGYGDYSGNILYPFILKSITYLTNFFGQDQYSRLWNFIIIMITSSLSVISLRLLRLSSSNLFNNKISNIASILFIVNPYTYYYSLSGGITNFLVVGVSSILYFFSRRQLGNISSRKNNIKETLIIIFLCSYLSLLRPSGGLFSFVILIFLLWEIIKKAIRNQVFENEGKIESFAVLLAIIFVSYNISSTLEYSFNTVKLFANEEGWFFGYPRDYLREQLIINTDNIFTNIKHTLYFLMWKITDFVSGLSDVRDTHTQFRNEGVILPFIVRTFTGIFILFPINLFSLIGILSNLKFIIKSQIWIVLFAGFIAVSPSLLGTAMSRYLIMFYPPFLVFSAKMIHDTFLGIKQSK